MDFDQRFWEATLEDMKQGYTEESSQFTCLLCGKGIEKGIIYPRDDRYYEAEKYMQHHITTEHQSVFHYLISLNKKMTGLTDHQNNILRLFYEGKSDQAIKEELEIGSTTTIRHHRFALKEKERQAKIFLTMMELLKGQDQKVDSLIPIHKNATMVDERFDITLSEEKKLLEKYFPDRVGQKLTHFPRREKHKIVVLRAITKLLDDAKQYTEKELNQIIQPIYEDYIQIRRYLIEYGFLDRHDDGSAYWVKK